MISDHNWIESCGQLSRKRYKWEEAILQQQRGYLPKSHSLTAFALNSGCTEAKSTNYNYSVYSLFCVYERPASVGIYLINRTLPASQKAVKFFPQEIISLTFMLMRSMDFYFVKSNSVMFVIRYSSLEVIIRTVFILSWTPIHFTHLSMLKVFRKVWIFINKHFSGSSWINSLSYLNTKLN